MTKYLVKRKYFLSLIIFIFFVTGIFSPIVLAQGGLQFGGFIVSSIYCTCSGNFLLTIQQPLNGTIQLTYNWTPQYEYYQLPRAGVWTVGLYTPGGGCWMWFGHHCNYYGSPSGAFSPTVGTSL